jgi:hypothetical protein
MNQFKELLKNSPIANQEGRIGYIIAWLMGVPASVLLLIFLIRGH